MRIRRDKDNFIKPIILLGVCVFFICLGTCVFHIYSIRDSLEEGVNQQLMSQLGVAGEVLEADLKNTESIIMAVSAEMGEKGKNYIPTRQIYKILEKYKSIDNFQQIAYLTEEGMIYFDDGWCRDSSDLVKEGLEDIQESRLYVTNDFWLESEEWLLLYIVPVMSQGERNGFIIGLKECRDILMHSHI